MFLLSQYLTFLSYLCTRYHHSILCLRCFMLSLPVMTPLIYHPLRSLSSMFFPRSSCSINILPKCYCHSSNLLLVRKTQKRRSRLKPGLSLKTSKRKSPTPLQHLYSYNVTCNTDTHVPECKTAFLCSLSMTVCAQSKKQRG